MIERWRGATRSLFAQLMIAFSVIVLAVVVLSTLILSDFMETALKRQMADGMMQDTEGVALWARPYMAAADVPDDIVLHLPWLHAVTEGRLWIINTDGIVVGDSVDQVNHEGRKLEHVWLSRVLGGERLTETDPDPWLDAAITVGRPIYSGDRIVGAAFLFASPARLKAVVADFRTLILVTGGIAAALGLLMAYTIARRFARPIEMMARFADNLGQKQFAGPLPATRTLELERLAEALGNAGSQLQRAFGALSEEKQRIAALIRDMAEGVVAVDEDRGMLLVNPAASWLLGNPGPFDGLPLRGAGLPPVLERALRDAVGREATEQEVVAFRCGALEVSARVSAVAGAWRGHGAVALLRDVTTEVQLRRMRENFVANVSHELRGPLASLSAGVEAMHDGLIPPDSRPRYLKAMLAEIGRLRRLVNDLLELSRLDAGMLEIPQEEFDLSPLCDGLAEKWEPKASAGGITLRVECPHLRVVANYDRVEEILANFLDNALRFTPAGGSVRVFAQGEGDMVRVGVADTGSGIAGEHLPHIWERFYKVDPARTRVHGAGTGLGLSIVRQLVDRLGGEVAVESDPGRGSTFSFTLVAARPSDGGQ